MVLNVAKWEIVFGLIQDLQLTIEQSQMVISHSDTEEDYFLGYLDSLVNWIKDHWKACLPREGGTAQLPL